MACERPILIRNPKGGTLRAICGTCRSCLIDDIKDWSFRLQIENKRCFNGYFVTLTYAEEFCPEQLIKEDLQKFIKQLRNITDYYTNIYTIPEGYKKFRYFAVGEYGENFGRPHFHLLLFNIPATRLTTIKKLLFDAWQKGIVHVGNIEDKSINYVCKYIFKQKHHYRDDKTPPFRLMSTNPAIGKGYIDTHTDYHYNSGQFCATVNGKKRRLPRYYKSKIFDDDLKEQFKEKTIENLNRNPSPGTDGSAAAEENVKNSYLLVRQRIQANEHFFQKNKI